MKENSKSWNINVLFYRNKATVRRNKLPPAPQVCLTAKARVGFSPVIPVSLPAKHVKKWLQILLPASRPGPGPQSCAERAPARDASGAASGAGDAGKGRSAAGQRSPLSGARFSAAGTLSPTQPPSPGHDRRLQIQGAPTSHPAPETARCQPGPRVHLANMRRAPRNFGNHLGMRRGARRAGGQPAQDTACPRVRRPRASPRGARDPALRPPGPTHLPPRRPLGTRDARPVVWVYPGRTEKGAGRGNGEGRGGFWNEKPHRAPRGRGRGRGPAGGDPPRGAVSPPRPALPRPRAGSSAAEGPLPLEARAAAEARFPVKMHRRQEKRENYLSPLTCEVKKKIKASRRLPLILKALSRACEAGLRGRD